MGAASQQIDKMRGKWNIKEMNTSTRILYLDMGMYLWLSLSLALALSLSLEISG